MVEENGYNLRFCEEKLIPLIKNIAKKYVEVPFQVEKKSHGNFVTSVDRKMENELKAQLHHLIPEAGFIAEENDQDSKMRLNWVVDPIDGTTNFIYGLPYAVSVALTKLNQTVIGVVYSPKTDTLYYACSGQGSYVINNGVTKRLSVGKFSDEEGLAIFGMPYNRKKTDKIFDIAKKVYQFSSDLKRIGPSSLDICMVAEGKAKLYFELDLNIRDICAGVLILKEVGGEFMQEDDLFLLGTYEAIDMYRNAS